MVRKMRAWDAAPVERDLMKLLVEKVENRVGGRSGSKIQREIKRVLSTHAKADGWLEAPTLARALQATWLVGLEQGEVLNFCDGLAARMPGGKLSCDRFAQAAAARRATRRRRRPVFDSETGDALGEHLVSCGRGGEVRCLASCPTDATTFGTAGDGHVAFWTLERSGGLRKRPAASARSRARATTRALAFSCTAPGVAFSGGSNGRVYVWRDGVCLASFAAHGTRPVRSLSRRPAGDAVLSAGDDGAVRRWAGPRLSAQGDCAIVASKRPASADAAAAAGAAVAGVVYARCLDGEGARPSRTARGTLMTVDVTTEAGKRGAVDGRKIRSLVVEGHVGPARDVAAHPTDGATFATCGDDRRVVTWTLDRKLKHATLPRAATALVYSEPSGASLVVGLEDGTVHFLDAESLDDAHGFEALRETAVTALAFSPDGDLLAVGARSGKVLLFDPRKTTKPLASLSGHHAAVEALDFGVEGSGLVVLRSQDGAGELFYWAVDGKASRRLTRRDDLDDHASWRWKSWTARDATRGIDAVDRAHGRDAYVVADADGLELRSAPAAAPDGPPDELRRGVVHTTKVARLAFLADDAHVVSLAKGDRAVVVWAADAGENYATGEHYSPGPSSASPAYLEAQVSQDDDAENFPPDAEEDGDWPF
ncbi:microtubule-associated protein [Aureococcus anophagefferens]|uniref:Microtubule-associated protein n=1 Tax=Aureococcus anophagefferens TaxID=44056 RepID=A0ABR1G8V6_AURAN